MKTRIILFLLFAIALGTCKKETRLTAKKIKDIRTEAQWDIRITHSSFSSTEAAAERSCSLFNDEIKGLVNGIQAAFTELCEEQIAALDSTNTEMTGKYELSISDSVYMATEQYISVLVQTYEYMGGANGNTNYYALNYDVRNNRFITNKELVDYEKSNEINTLLKSCLKDPDNCYTFKAPTIEDCSAINFTRNSVEFTYGKYLLGPGSCGPVTISVPSEKLKGILKINFQ